VFQFFNSFKAGGKRVIKGYAQVHPIRKGNPSPQTTITFLPLAYLRTAHIGCAAQRSGIVATFNDKTCAASHDQSSSNNSWV